MNRCSDLQREMTRLLEAGVSSRVFPGAVACLGYRDGDEDVFVSAQAGTVERDGSPVVRDTIYDLASLTKPLVAVTALRLAEAGKLDLDQHLSTVLTNLPVKLEERATLRGLLSHRSGLAAWGGLYLDVPHNRGTGAARRWILAEACRRGVAESSGRGCVYSDLGYLLAGAAIAKLTDRTLDAAVREWTTVPLGIADSVFFAGTRGRSSMLRRKAAPTERCDWRGELVRGEVHDENCAALGGVAGNAGMFGRAHGVARFGRAMLDCYHGRSSFCSKNCVADALADPGDGESLRLGWDTPTPKTSSAGKRVDPHAFGHLGFTGTSIWCDPRRDLCVVLLSNRVYPSRANSRIRGFRPAFHDAVFAVFDRSRSASRQ